MDSVTRLLISIVAFVLIASYLRPSRVCLSGTGLPPEPYRRVDFVLSDQVRGGWYVDGRREIWNLDLYCSDNPHAEVLMPGIEACSHGYALYITESGPIQISGLGRD